MFDFGKRKSAKINKTRGADGIRECDRILLGQFQAECEANNDYDALKAALKCARDVNFVVNEVNLGRFIRDARWADMGGTRD